MAKREKSKCPSSIESHEDLLGVLHCERQYEHKGSHRETWWVGKGSKAYRIRVSWKEKRRG